MSIFTERLCQMVEKRCISWSTLAYRTNISSSRISQYKTGVYQPKMDGLHSIARVLDVNPYWLIGETDVKSPYPVKDKEDVEPFDKQLLRAYSSASENIRKAIRVLLELDEKEHDAPDWSCFTEIRGGA